MEYQMKNFKLAGTIPALAFVFAAGAASAASVTPTIIFGTGNANGGFTRTDTTLDFPTSPFTGSLELGRALDAWQPLAGCVPGHGYKTARCAGHAAILTPVAASGSRAFCSALI